MLGRLTRCEKAKGPPLPYLFKVRAPDVNHPGIVCSSVVAQHRVDRARRMGGALHGRFDNPSDEALALLRPQRSARDNARNPEVVVPAFAGRFDNSQGAHETRCRRSLARPRSLPDILLHEGTSVFWRGRCMDGTTDFVAPDVGSPGTMFGGGTSIRRMAHRCGFLNGCHRYFGLVNGLHRLVWHLY